MMRKDSWFDLLIGTDAHQNSDANPHSWKIDLDQEVTVEIIGNGAWDQMEMAVAAGVDLNAIDQHKDLVDQWKKEIEIFDDWMATDA